MDDEFDIRERNAEIVMQLVGEANREVIPLYAQELFIGFLVDKLRNFKKHEVIAMLTSIVIDGTSDDNSLEENIVEYRVFEKNEVNIFSETFLIRKQCISKLKEKMAEISDESLDDEILKVVGASRKFKNEENVENFLRTLTKS